jgi:hypothetical protein
VDRSEYLKRRSRVRSNSREAKFDREMAGAIGHYDAVVLEDVLERSKEHYKGVKIEDGCSWIRVSGRKWTEEMWPWASRGTVSRTLAKLVKRGLLYARNDMNEHGYDRTNWYAVNFDQLAALDDSIALLGRKFKLGDLPPSMSWEELVSMGGSQRSTHDPAHADPPSEDVPMAHREPPDSGTMAHREPPSPEVDPDQPEPTILKDQRDGLSLIQQSWTSFLELVGDQMSKDVYRNSFQGSRPVQIDGAVLEVETPGQREADWINNRVGESALSAFLATNAGSGIEKLWARPCQTN